MTKDVPHTVKDFFEDYPLRRFDKGDIIVRPEEPVEMVFYLIGGSVVQYDISPAGNEVVVNVFKPLAFFSMSTAINHTPNYYYFEALSPVVVRVAPSVHVVDFVKQNSDVLFDLLARVYRGTDGLQRRMAHLMGGSAYSRLIYELINASSRFGQQKGSSVLIPLTENDLAKRSGLSRETVSRTMRKLKDSDLVRVQAAGITILDVYGLEALLGNEL
jgi:CRP/FNR family cyclic AMP-dependent transcriptional regulator